MTNAQKQLDPQLYERLKRAVTPPGHVFWVAGRPIEKSYTGKVRQ